MLTGSQFSSFSMCDEACVKVHDGSSTPSYTTVSTHGAMWHLEDVPWVPSSVKAPKKLQGSVAIESSELPPIPPHSHSRHSRSPDLMGFAPAIGVIELQRHCTTVLKTCDQDPQSRTVWGKTTCVRAWGLCWVYRLREVHPQSQVSELKLLQQQDRIRASAVSCYKKKNPSTFPHSKAKPENTTWACLSGAADTISAIINRLGTWADYLQQLKVLSLRTDL